MSELEINKGGRPTDYGQHVIDASLKYIESCIDDEYEFHKSRGTTSDSFEEKVRTKLPKIEGLALHLKVSRDTIYEWEKQHKEFSDILEQVRQLQAERLIDGAISGRYNAAITKLLLAKHGYRESTDVTTDGKAISITFDPSFKE